MLTVILSDPHGNQAALQAVLDDAYRRFRPAEIWHLGDTVGYGPDPFRVWLALESQPIPTGCWLAGNHDWGLISKLLIRAKIAGTEFGKFRQEAAAVLRYHQELLADKKELYERLAACPVMSEPVSGVYLTHGSFESSAEQAVTRYLVTTKMPLPALAPAEMVANFYKAAEKGEALTATAPAVPQLFAFGHNHLPGVWRWQENGWQPLPLRETHRLDDPSLGPICFNPGSVGFPRDGLGCPSYALIEWDNHGPARKPVTLRLQRVWYDANLTRNKMAVEPYKQLLTEANFLADCSERAFQDWGASPSPSLGITD